MSLEELTALAISAAAISTVLVQFIKDLWVDPNIHAEPQRSSLLRAINYLLNLGLLILAVATAGKFAWSDLWQYIALAFGQAVAAHAGYQFISGGAGVDPTKTPQPVTMSGQPQILPPPPDIPDVPDVPNEPA